MTDQEILERVKDPAWRLSNLYWITNLANEEVIFKPNAVQQRFLDRIWFRNVVPKARKRGFSTLAQLLMLDACLFVPNTIAAVIAQDEDTAMSIFETKVRFAYERLPAVIQAMCPLKYDTKTSLTLQNGSSLTVDTSTRGLTPAYLHISEFGYICLKRRDLVREIMTGAIPSVPASAIIIVESTVESPYGEFADMVKQAMAIEEAGKPLTKLDWRLHWASWWDEPNYELDPEHVTISPKDHAYFNRIEAEIGRDIGPRKRAWYVKQRDTQLGGSTESMYSQFPSTLKEAFTISTEGLWLSEVLARARREGRIMRLPIEPSVPVNTFWDLGVDDDVAIWLHQKVGPWDHFFDFIEGAGEPYAYFVGEMQKRQAEGRFVWGRHYLPHDGAHRRPGAEVLKTSADMLEELDLRNIEIVPRVADLTNGIQQLRDAFARYRLDEARCAEAIKHLEGYSKTWNDRLGVWTAQVLKNGHQHAADALRQHAQIRHAMVDPAAPKRPRGRRGSWRVT